MSPENEMSIRNDNMTIVSRLNQLLRIDPIFTRKIVNTRYFVNDDYINSQGFMCIPDESGRYSAGLIGVINGLINSPDRYRIAAKYNNSNDLQRFALMELVDNQWKEV